MTIILIIILGFIINYWDIILISITSLILVCLLIFYYIRYSIHKEELNRINFLKNEPIRFTETIDDRLKSRYLESCSKYFDAIAHVHMNWTNRNQKDPHWRDSLEDYIEKYMKNTINEDQYKLVIEILKNNRSQNHITYFERPIIDRSNIISYEYKMKMNDKKNILINEFNQNNMNGLQFEIWCANVLKLSGWDAKVTKASGDQGADIIATKAGVKLAIQCKHYNGSVGNKAVQEINAAKLYYNAHYAIVVAKEKNYTKGAKDLASIVSVKLLSADDIYRIDQFL